MKLADVRTKYEELKKEKLSSRIEWTEERPFNENPTTEGLASGNVFPGNRYMLEQMSEDNYKLYLLIYDMYIDILILSKEELEAK